MFRRKRDKDMSRSYSMTADPRSSRSVGNSGLAAGSSAGSAAAAAAFSASKRNSAVLSSAAAATAIKRHSLTSEQAHLSNLNYPGSPSLSSSTTTRGRANANATGRTYSMTSSGSAGGLHTVNATPSLRRSTSNANSLSGGNRRASLQSSPSIPHISTTVETSNSGRTMSLTTTTVRRFGAFELIKTNTTTGTPASIRAANANNRPFSQFTQVGSGARAGYASSVLSYESDLNPVYEDEPLTKPSSRTSRPRGASPTPKISLSVAEENGGVESGEQVKLHVPPPRSASPTRPALKDSSQASSIASSDDMSSANNLQVSVTSTSDATTNEQVPNTSNNIVSPNRVLGKKPRREVSFVDINGETLDDDYEEIVKVKALSPIEAAARNASVRNQSAKFHSESTKLVEQRRNKQSAAAAAMSSFKKPTADTAASAPPANFAPTKRMSVESSDSGHSVYSDALEDNGSPIRSIDDVVLRRHSTKGSKSRSKGEKTASPSTRTTKSTNHNSNSNNNNDSTPKTPPKTTSDFQPLELSPLPGNLSDDLEDTIILDKDTENTNASATENGSVNVDKPASHFTHHYRQLAESDDEDVERKSIESDTATAREFQTPLVSTEELDHLPTQAAEAAEASEVSKVPEAPEAADDPIESPTAKGAGATSKKVNIADEAKVNIISQDSFDDGADDYESDYENDQDDNISLSSDSSWQRERAKKRVPRKTIMLSMRSDETARLTPQSRPVSVLSIPQVGPYKKHPSTRGSAGGKRDARSAAANGKGFKFTSLRGAFDEPSLRSAPTAPSSDSDGAAATAGVSRGDGFLSSFKSRFADSDSEGDDDAGHFSSYRGSAPNGNGASSSSQAFKSLRKPKSQPHISSLPVPPVSSVPHSSSLSADIHRLSTLPEAPEPLENTPKQRVSSNGSSKSKFKSMFSPNNQAKVLLQKKERAASSQSTASYGQAAQPSSAKAAPASHKYESPSAHSGKKKRFPGLRRVFNLE